MAVPLFFLGRVVATPACFLRREKPRWVEVFEENRRRLELSGREGAETLEA